MNTQKKRSFIEPNKSIDQTVEDRFLYVIENEVRTPPYISVLSKKQMYNKNGVHFKIAKEPYIKAGLLQNLNIRIPCRHEIEKTERYYGYQALVYPWGELNTIINRIMRTKILKNTLNGNSLKDIRVMLGRGYIRKDGTLDPAQTTGISVYILFLADPEYRQAQNEWIREQKEWMRFQIARNQDTHRDILEEKKKQASKLVQINRKLIQQTEYKQLEPHVNRARLPWTLGE